MSYCTKYQKFAVKIFLTAVTDISFEERIVISICLIEEYGTAQQQNC